MATNTKLAALIIMAVVVVPVLVGYAMPAQTVMETGYETVTTTNITDSLATDSIPNWTGYAGSQNSWPLMDENGTGFTTSVPVASTDNPSSVPYWTWRNIEYGPSGPIEPSDSYSVEPTDTNTVQIIRADSRLFSVDGVLYSTLIQFPDRVVAANHEGPDIGFTDITSRVLEGPISVVASGTVAIGYITYVDGYTDLSRGFLVPLTSGIWSNGYLNRSIDVLLRPITPDATGQGDDADIRLSMGGVDVRLLIDGGTATATVAGTTRTIGAGGSYSYYLVSYDALAGTVSVSGLAGLTGFMDQYRSKIANTLTVETDIGPIRGFTMEAPQALDDPSAAFYVPYTVVQSSTVWGIQDATFDPSDYYPDNLWQVAFSSPAVFGDTIRIGPTTYNVTNTGRIAGVALTVDGVRDSYDIPIRDMVITAFPSDSGGFDVTINGYYWGTVSNLPITLGGNWLLSVYLSDLDSFQFEEYRWKSGGFNLDLVGFCTVGLLTSVAAFLVTALMGRRSGSKVGLLLLVAGICAAFYLVMLESYL